MMKVKKGDTVLVIAGKDKGAKGKVIQAYPERDRVLVEGVNRIKKHTKVTHDPAWRASPAASSPRRRRSTCRNVKVCDADSKPTRVGQARRG